MDLGKGMFLATFTINYIFSTNYFSLIGLLSGGMISVYISLRLLERKKKKNAGRSK